LPPQLFPLSLHDALPIFTLGEIAGYGGQAMLHLLSMRSGFKTVFKCFAAGTPVRTPDGERPIEQLRRGDWVLSRAEGDEDGSVRSEEHTSELQSLRHLVC